MKKAKYFKKLKNGKVKCQACNWYCEIEQGNTGICGVRQNIDGGLFLLVYGKSVAVHTDPVEKKPLYHFLPETDVFSIGTIGCNFKCGFCQNWDISQMSRKIKKELTKEGKADDLGVKISSLGYDLPPGKIVEYCLENDIPSIAYTYNEPTIYLEYAIDTAELAQKEGIKNILVTNGYMTKETYSDIAEYIDAANIDLKSFSEKFYQKHCKAKLAPVLETIKELHKRGVWLELTTLVIPGENDSEKELKKIAEFISGVSNDIPWHVSRFHPDYEMMDKGITPDKSIESAVVIGKDEGLKYVYPGNVGLLGIAEISCPKCGGNLDRKLGKCPNCDEEIAGIWE